MIRALYTAASGMNAQQMNIDNVAHNLANVNTTGFKKSRVEFEDLVYQELRAPGASASASTEAPVGLEVGLGTRAVATARNFSSGNLTSTGSPIDIALGRADRDSTSFSIFPLSSRRFWWTFIQAFRLASFCG